MRVLVTAGGTREPIDGVRFLCNASTGATGAFIAEYFRTQGADVLLAAARGSVHHPYRGRREEFVSHADLTDLLRTRLSREEFDSVIHAAAVGDYSVESISRAGEDIPVGRVGKLDSGEVLTITLRPTEKILDHLRDWSRNGDIRIVAFKLTDHAGPDEREAAVKKLAQRAHPDVIVHNDASEIAGEIHPVRVYRGADLIRRGKTLGDLAAILWENLGGRNEN